MSFEKEHRKFILEIRDLSVNGIIIIITPNVLASRDSDKAEMCVLSQFHCVFDAKTQAVNITDSWVTKNIRWIKKYSSELYLSLKSWVLLLNKSILKWPGLKTSLWLSLNVFEGYSFRYLFSYTFTRMRGVHPSKIAIGHFLTQAKRYT